MRNFGTIGMLALALFGCNGEESDTAGYADTDSDTDTDSDADTDSDTDTEPLSVVVDGSAAKGPFVRGSSLSIAEVDADGLLTGRVFLTETSDDSGRFSLTVDFAGPVRLEAQGYYYNEVTGRLSSAPITLRAYGEVGGVGTTLHVNLLTHLASQRVRALVEGGASIADATATADAEVHAGLGIGPSVVIGAATDLDLTGGDTDDNAYVFAVSAVLAQVAADRAGPDGPVDGVLTELINGMAIDLQDGKLDGDGASPTADDLRLRQSTIDADALMDLLAARFAAIGVNTPVPDLHRIFDVDLDNLPDREDTDDDNDGFAGLDEGGADCDDADVAVFPGAVEIWHDAVDQDCAADSDDDADGDGRDDEGWGGDDCDDDEPTTYPGAADAWYDGVDSDCAGDSDFDADVDDFDAVSGGGLDCDDADAAIYPGATDAWYDGVDSNCDAWSDDDADLDGFDAKAEGGADCDDATAAVNPDATEVPYDGLDQDCDAWSDDDADLDGADDLGHGGDDCDDTVASTGPASPELPDDGVDNNCDGLIEDDRDDDGHFDDAGGGDDCDDTRADTHPGAMEVWYDDVDQACDFGSDFDADGDGYDKQTWGDDCDDADPDVRPFATEIWYDGVDGNCDGGNDFDADGDGYVDEAHGGDDCDDKAKDTHPGAAEFCGSDMDCDGVEADCPMQLDLIPPDATVTLSGVPVVVGPADLNNDGFDDLVYGGAKLNSGAGGVVITFGPVSGTVGAPDVQVRGVLGTLNGFGYTWVADDFDGDGDDDLLAAGGFDRHVLLAGPILADTTGDKHVAWFKSTAPNTRGGGEVYAAGDFDGDGVADAALRGDTVSAGPGVTYLVLEPGNRTGNVDLATDAIVLQHETGGASGGAHGFDHADQDGDGYDDAFVGMTVNAKVWMVRGRAAPAASYPLASADAVISASVTYSAQFGNRIVGLPDVDADGNDEVLIQVGAESLAGVYQFYGPLSGTQAITSAPTRYVPGGTNVQSMGFIGDLAGDGTSAWYVYDGSTGGGSYVWNDVPRASYALRDAPWFTPSGSGIYPLGEVGDLDADGCADVALGTSHGVIKLWSGCGL